MIKSADQSVVEYLKKKHPYLSRKEIREALDELIAEGKITVPVVSDEGEPIIVTSHEGEEEL